MGDLLPDHFLLEKGIGEDDLRRHRTALQNLLGAVNIREEQVQRLHALDEAGFEPHPFGAAEHARHDIEGDQPLGRILVAIDGESDADAAKQEFRLGAARGEKLGGRIGEPTRNLAVDGTDAAIGLGHFIEILRHLRNPIRKRRLGLVKQDKCKSGDR